ncbi:tRNA (adenosine(37)-N6)-dimethylallyltransferase MiaA [Puniceicoccaceae bacterium K14]|nr:tRNA (adenosine(37)-N6)-dimethylallyltransferase MiaA [Puniceicoccaceae bacterium K14]
MSQLETLYALTGCTAVGKTELALLWAETYGAEIINCDSLLFYRGMDIGTAKPTREELARVPHHLVDLCPASEQMDVARFIELAIETAREIQARGNRVLITGGSGFYLKAFFHPVVDDVAISEATAIKVSKIQDSGGLEALKDTLLELSPDAASQVDLENPRRVLKALERCIESGLSVGELKNRFAKQINPLIDAPKKLTILHRDKEELNARIALRVDIMLEQGLIDEVKELRVAGFEANGSAAHSIGYRETLAYLDGQLTLEQLKIDIATNTRRLAKKQRTWFRGQLPEGSIHEISDTHSIELKNLFD